MEDSEELSLGISRFGEASKMLLKIVGKKNNKKLDAVYAAF